MADRLSFVQLEAGRRLFFGLDWASLDDALSRHDQVQAWRERGYTWSATFRHNKQTQLGLAAAEDSLEGLGKKGLAISGAALLASMQGISGGTGLYLLLSQGNVYAIALIDGRIVFDKVISEQDVVSTRSEFQAECSRAGVSAVFVGTEGHEQITGHLDQWLSWDALRQAKKGFKRASLQPLKSDRYDWILVGSSLLVLATLAGGWAWREHTQAQKLKQLQLAAMANDPTVLYQEAIQKFQADPRAVTPLSSALDALTPFLGSLQSQRALWQLQSVTCEIEKNICVSKWGPTSSRMATFTQFKKEPPALPQEWQLQMGPKLDSLEVLMPVSLPHAAATPLTKLPTLQDFMGADGSVWQSLAPLGVEVTVQEPVAQQVPQSVPLQVAQNVPFALLAARWTVNGAPWWAIDALKGSGSNVTLEKLTVSMTGLDLKFSAEGKAYVRK